MRKWFGDFGNIFGECYLSPRLAVLCGLLTNRGGGAD
jgi:hypothetical protein